MFYVYILKSKNFQNKIYVGSTNNLVNRIKQHNDGENFSTKTYRPWILKYYEAYDEENLARAREAGLKHHGNAIRQLKKRAGIL